MNSSLIRVLTAFFLSFQLLPAIAEDNTNFANYARYGADVWARNPMANISGEGKACISCHTSMPYALVEPLIDGDYAAYDDMIDNIRDRVLGWRDNTPWYADDKLEATAIAGGLPPDALKSFLNGPDSRGVEAVFNTLILAARDAYAGQSAQPVTVRAFENLWAEQVKEGPATGRWRWIKANLLPWEVLDSDIWGAALACVATSMFPDLADEGGKSLLDQSLSAAFDDDTVSRHARTAILWCHSESGGNLLAADRANTFIEDLMSLQLPDRGWALRSLGPWADWEGSDSDCCANRELRSDMYATGLVMMALTRAGANDQFAAEMATAMRFIESELDNPYPDGPRYNRHESSAAELPEFRNNLYNNAGHMWGFLAKSAYETGQAPWMR